MSDDQSRWDALKAELSEPDYSLPIQDPPLERELEHDPFAAYRGSDVRTFIPKEEHGDVRNDDVFEWTSEDGGYYLWRRKGDE